MRSNHSISLGISYRSKSQKKTGRNSSSFSININTRTANNSSSLIGNLKKENIKLRQKLKEFNESLNFFIEKNNNKREYKDTSEVKPEENLETVKKRLKYYE